MIFGAGAWLAIAGIVPLAAAQTLEEKVSTDGKITIGIYNTWPWGFTEDGKAKGVGPELLEASAEALKIKSIDFQVMDFGALIPSLQSRRIDIIAGGMYIKAKRCPQVAFSDPIGGPEGNTALVKTGNPLNIHTYEDMAKNPNARISNLRSAASTEYLSAAGVPKDRLQQYPDKDAAVAALLADRIDALVLDTGTVVGILKDNQISGIERAVPFKENAGGHEIINYNALAFRPEDAAFRDLFNKRLAELTADGTVEKIFLKYGYTKDDATPTGAIAKDVCGADYH